MTSRALKDIQRDIDDVAGYWLVRLQSPACTPQDHVAFEKWKGADPANKEAYERLRRGNSMMDRLLAEPEILAMAEEACAETRPSFWWVGNLRVAAVAASLMLVIGLSFVVLTRSESVPEVPTIAELAAPEPKVFATAIGQRSTITLLDNSEVTLNVDSQIEVAFEDDERRIILTKGQAYFKVAKDETRPFVVVANDRRIIAVGTEFDVRFREEGKVEVTLIEGRVDVELFANAVSGEHSNDRLEILSLRPGEKLIDTEISAPSIASAKVADETSWMTGKLIFRDRPLPEVVAELNLYSSKKIVLGSDPRINGLKVSGVFRTGRAYTFVGALEAMHSLQAKQISDNEVRLEWAE